MKNKKSLIIAIVVVVILLTGATFYFLSTRNSAATPVDEPGTEIEVVPTIAPDKLGLTLEMGDDGKRVIMTIKNTKDITGVDYELSYTAKDDIPRGAIGHADVTEPGKAIKQEIVLGTCSDVCHYDSDVKNIKLVVKITKIDNKIYQSELDLEE
jgi:hypothetical protein